MNNIAIIGSPGSGKTELAKWYVSFLDKDGARVSLLDIDDDVLTPLTVRNIALGLSMSEGISYSEALVRSMTRSCRGCKVTLP